MKAIVSIISVVFAVCILDAACAATWYVAPPPLGNNKNPGTEEQPFADIQKGIDKAVDGDTVIVAEGTYVENISFKGKNIVLTSTDPTNWNAVRNTIIDGSQSGSVVTLAGTEDETCMLCGFTIRNGSGTMFLFDVTPVLCGAGIYGGDFQVRRSGATVENNIITANGVREPGGTFHHGGAIYHCGGLMRNNVVVGNIAGEVDGCHGGAFAFCAGIIEGNLIAANSSFCGGGLAHCNATIRNNTVVANTAAIHGSGLSHCGTSGWLPGGAVIANDIVWGNICPSAPQIGDSVAPGHCCIQDWTGGGTGNIALDPQFVDPDGPDDDPNTYEDNDYRLLISSPCIDSGINEDWMNGATDLDGKPRILLGAASLNVDMGAYELTFPLSIARNTPTDVELSWVMRALKSYTVLSTSDVLLQPWAEETTILGGKSGGPASWTDPDASPSLKFYRLEVK